ncbi:hypothetical protein ARMGADRAFT_1073687 [Armillaria gallica]|uniref:Heterokaryon incompatibility domain-containing protein n=1 Tax=Armillaria gallica TaxID=47427 RepID=A0A2H3E1Q8_ARMGA|nr:hypothetical protein ARMGADRAFT_1073687 [Armillaria gallica]
MFLSNARSYWRFLKLKTEIVLDKWTSKSRYVLPKPVEGDHSAFDSESGETSDADTPLQPEVTISSQTEIGKPVIPSFLANTPCSSLGIQGLLDLLNTTLGTSYTLDTPSISFVLEDCIAQNFDFGTVYGRLRSAWCDHEVTDIQMVLRKSEAEDIDWRRDAFDGNRIVDMVWIRPRRVWDLYSNRVVPWWSCRVGFRYGKHLRPISHAWLDEVDRVDELTPINGREWPVPIPKGANLDLIRIEMLNIGLEYTWLDVLCLRQRGGPREDLREEEWKLDVPTIGGIYDGEPVVIYLSGLGLPLSLKEGDLESDRCWFRRAWTLQEIGRKRMIVGDTPDGPMHAKPIDEAGNYKDEILTKFYKQLKAADDSLYLYDTLSAMQDRISTYPVDKVAGLAFCLMTRSIPAYYESQSLEDAWSALINETDLWFRGMLLFTYPEPGSARKKWRPSWEQVMTKSLPKNPDPMLTYTESAKDDLYRGLPIKRGIVRGLAVGGVKGSDRYGELVVEDVRGIAHIFNIVASHQYPIPEDTYTLLGIHPAFMRDRHHGQYWVVGRLSNKRAHYKRFEKVSVFQMADLEEIERIYELCSSVKPRSFILA